MLSHNSRLGFAECLSGKTNSQSVSKVSLVFVHGLDAATVWTNDVGGIEDAEHVLDAAVTLNGEIEIGENGHFGFRRSSQGDIDIRIDLDQIPLRVGTLGTTQLTATTSIRRGFSAL